MESQNETSLGILPLLGPTQTHSIQSTCVNERWLKTSMPKCRREWNCDMPEKAAIVIIGRNEGGRLRRCLESLCRTDCVKVYVDSASSDGSVGLARSLGAEVVELDSDTPFSAARARNAGFAKALEMAPQVQYVQFVDGDCQIVKDWLERAVCELNGRADLAVVCGRLRERYPAFSIYNRLCDLEWDEPPGEAQACGGNAVMRVSAFDQAGGFNSDVIAGEEPELCFRLRLLGWKIERLDQEMMLHDAAMHRFSQWWKRSVRGGYAYALGRAMHGKSKERYCVRDCRRIWFWGLCVPFLAVSLAWPTRGWSAFLLLAYAVLMVRIYRHGRRRGWGAGDSSLHAVFVTLAKWPGLVGMCRFYLQRATRGRARIIEYKAGRTSFAQ